MIDLETLDTIASAVVVQIGLVSFSIRDGIQEEHLWNLDLEDQRPNRTISTSTIGWWMEQGLKLPKETLELYPSLCGLKEVLQKIKPDLIWYRGPTFDHVILTDLLTIIYDKKDIDKLLPFWKVRDSRTLDIFNIKRERGPVAHYALEDAREQALDVIHVTKTITSKLN